MDSRCKQRSHAWSEDPPIPGRSVCKRRGCGKKYIGRGKRPAPKVHTQPKKATPPPIADQERTAGEAQAAPEPHAAGFDLLAERWGRTDELELSPTEQEAMNETFEPEPEPEPKPKAEPEDTNLDKTTIGEACKVVAPVATQLMVGLTAGLVRWLGRDPNEPDPANLEQLQKCWELLIRAKFPDIKISPFGGVCLFGGLNAAGMWMGAKKIPKANPPKLRSVPLGPPEAPSPQPPIPTAAPTANTPATAGGGEVSQEPKEPRLVLVSAEDYAARKKPNHTPDPFSTTTTEGPGNATNAQDGSTDQ